MNAMVATDYDSPDVLQFTAVEIPAPPDDEVLMTRRQTLLDAPATNAQWINLGGLAAYLLAMAGRAVHFYRAIWGATDFNEIVVVANPADARVGVAAWDDRIRKPHGVPPDGGDVLQKEAELQRTHVCDGSIAVPSYHAGIPSAGDLWSES